MGVPGGPRQHLCMVTDNGIWFWFFKEHRQGAQALKCACLWDTSYTSDGHIQAGKQGWDLIHGAFLHWIVTSGKTLYALWQA